MVGSGGGGPSTTKKKRKRKKTQCSVGSERKRGEKKDISDLWGEEGGKKGGKGPIGLGEGREERVLSVMREEKKKKGKGGGWLI